MGKSNIGWTDEVWNVTRGCRRVSPGCGGPKGVGGCYAEKTAYRFSGEGMPYEGLVKLTTAGPRWTGDGRFVAEKLADPLRWRAPRRVFVDSMSDLFFEAFSNEQIAAVFGVMAACPQHTFQILTKRATRMREWFGWLEEHIEDDAAAWSGQDCTTSIDDAREQCILEFLDETATSALAGHFDVCHLGLTTNDKLTWPLPNAWIGVSVESQAAADERIPDLLATPAAVRFLSCEPLLGPIDARLTGCFHEGAGTPERPDEQEDHSECAARISWVIAGCESGPGARPCEVAWLRSLRDQCAAAGVAFFLKQMMVDGRLRTDPADFPPDLRIQEFPR